MRIRRKFQNVYFSGVIILWLSSCATHTPVEDEVRLQNWKLHNEQLLRLNGWELTGRIGISLEKEAWSASLKWTQEKQNYLLRIIAPLGRGTFELERNDSGVEMRLARDEVLRANDAETLMMDNFGWSVPVAGLIYWIRGIPDPGFEVKNILIDGQGRVAEMSQSGWQISYSRYSEHDKYYLPGRVVMNNRDLNIRLVIRNWSL